MTFESLLSSRCARAPSLLIVTTLTNVLWLLHNNCPEPYIDFNKQVYASCIPLNQKLYVGVYLFNQCWMWCLNGLSNKILLTVYSMHEHVVTIKLYLPVTLRVVYIHIYQLDASTHLRETLNQVTYVLFLLHVSVPRDNSTNTISFGLICIWQESQLSV